ncbi:MAG TPA: hypothetical protein VF003_01840 [Pseudonocardiaceae bacterium]
MTITVQGRAPLVVLVLVPPLVLRLSCSEISKRMTTTATPPMTQRCLVDAT